MWERSNRWETSWEKNWMKLSWKKTEINKKNSGKITSWASSPSSVLLHILSSTWLRLKTCLWLQFHTWATLCTPPYKWLYWVELTLVAAPKHLRLKKTSAHNSKLLQIWTNSPVPSKQVPVTTSRVSDKAQREYERSVTLSIHHMIKGEIEQTYSPPVQRFLFGQNSKISWQVIS